MNITTNDLVALGAILVTIGGCVHRVCLAVERAWPSSKAAQIATQVDSAVALVQSVTGKS